MPTYASSPQFDRLLAEFQAANGAEAVATTKLLSLLQSRAAKHILAAATTAMEEAHAKKMDALDRMQAHRLDKG